MDRLPLNLYHVITEIEAQEEEEILQLLIMIIAIEEYQKINLSKQPCRTSKLTGHDYVIELLNGHPERCYTSFRMYPNVFIAFCEQLRTRCGLKPSKYLSIQEQVAIFLIIIAYSFTNRLAAERFQHSGETISKYFHRVLKAVCKLGVEIIAPPDQNVIPPEIRYNPRYYPFFKDCIGAIDGTHIDACIPTAAQIPYRGRKTDTTQNVMAVCSFDMRFTYVLAGWEGTANDARVLLDCITKPEYNFPLPTGDKYYVVDSGYTNMPGFLAPYRGETYHLREFRASGRQPRNEEELFNYRHSSLRNVIERCFGVLKARFRILKKMLSYPVSTQKYIPVTCCTVHNFLRIHGQRDRLFDQYENEDMIVDEDTDEFSASNLQHEGDESQNPIQINVTQSQVRQMGNFRDEIARQIWENTH